MPPFATEPWPLPAAGWIDVCRGLDARSAFHSLAEVARAFHDFHLAKGPAGQCPSAELRPVIFLAPKT
jgi:hypothetical protein